jgi:hypothetical protein
MDLPLTTSEGAAGLAHGGSVGGEFHAQHRGAGAQLPGTTARISTGRSVGRVAVLALEVESPVFLEVSVADDCPEAEDGLGTVEAAHQDPAHEGRNQKAAGIVEGP